MTFTPQPGQTDYTNIRETPVINCVVTHAGRLLIVRRSEKLNFYPGLWNGVSGFLDDAKNEIEKARQELAEELGLEPGHILEIRPGAVFEVQAPEYDKVWLVHPLLVRINTDTVRLDAEASEYRWIEPETLESFECVPGFPRVLRAVLPEVFPNMPI